MPFISFIRAIVAAPLITFFIKTREIIRKNHFIGVTETFYCGIICDGSDSSDSSEKPFGIIFIVIITNIFILRDSFVRKMCIVFFEIYRIWKIKREESIITVFPITVITVINYLIARYFGGPFIVWFSKWFLIFSMCKTKLCLYVILSYFLWFCNQWPKWLKWLKIIVPLLTIYLVVMSPMICLVVLIHIFRFQILMGRLFYVDACLHNASDMRP